MIVKRATKEDLHQLAVLFDEYRQFYGASSNVEQSFQFLKHRFDNKDSVIFILKTMISLVLFYFISHFPLLLVKRITFWMMSMSHHLIVNKALQNN